MLHCPSTGTKRFEIHNQLSLILRENQQRRQFLYVPVSNGQFRIPRALALWVSLTLRPLGKVLLSTGFIYQKTNLLGYKKLLKMLCFPENYKQLHTFAQRG